MLTISRRLVTVAALLTVAAGPALAQRIAAPVAAHRTAAPVALTPTNAPADRASGFASSGFAQFMSSPAGRILRAAAGVGMIAGGVVTRDDGKTNGGTALAVAGLLPLSAGVFDVCYISPIFGGPFRGRDIRAAAGK